MFKRIENILPEADFNQLHDILTSFEFDWHYLPGTVRPEVKQDIIAANEFDLYESEQFIHVLYDTQPVSPYWKYIDSVVQSFETRLGKEVEEIARIKANMLVKNNSGNPLLNCPHVDRSPPGWHSLVYYLNDCDGDTVLFNKKGSQGFHNLQIQDTASPKKNTAVLFESDWYHTSTNPVDNPRRIVLNFILRFKNEK